MPMLGVVLVHRHWGICQWSTEQKQVLYTLQGPKLQGIKIRDVVVFSRYSKAKCFANDLSIFCALAQVAVELSGRAPDL